MYDVIIVGGSAAGLSAALTLGRFRRRVLICDHQKPRNAPADAAHNFFTRDGTPPAELLRIGREQLRPYPTVSYRLAEVVAVQKEAEGFVAQMADGSVEQARRILLATGVVDKLPAIPGLADYWAKGLYHCPYCHGWEVRDQKIVIIADAEGVYHLARLLTALSDDISACVQGDGVLSAEKTAVLAQLGVTLYTDAVTAVVGEAGVLRAVQLADGRQIACDAIFARTEPVQHSALARELGCAFTEQGYVQVDILGHTSVANVYAAGDIVSPLHQVIVAAASGAGAGSGINADIAMA